MTSSISQPSSNPLASPTGRSLLWHAVWVVLVSGCLLAAALVYLRGQTIESGRRLTQSFAYSIGVQTERTLQTVDQRLQLASISMAQMARDGTLTEESGRALLREQIKALPFVGALWVVDSQGRMVYETTVGNRGLNLMDRAYFQMYLQQPQTTFHVAAPVRSRISGKWLISAARPMPTNQGAFAGIIVAGLDPTYFDKLWGRVDLGAGGSATLMRRDGTVLMRSPFDEAVMGKTFSNLPVLDMVASQGEVGSYDRASAFDGIFRTFAYRVLADNPELMVIVGQSHGHILAPWWKLVVLTESVWLTASAVILLLCVYRGRDASRRMRVEQDFQESTQQLRQTEENLAITLQSIGDAVIATDAAGLITRVNATAESLTGWRRADALGRPLGEVFHVVNTLTRAPLADLLSVVMNADAALPKSSQVTLLPKDGGEYQISHTAAPICNANGSVVGVVAVFRDVTEKNRTQAALRESEDRYRTLIQWSPESVVVHRGGKILYVNPAAIRMFGAQTAYELVDTPILDRIHPDFQATVLARIKGVGLEGKIAPLDEQRYLKMDGTPFDVEVQGTAIVYDGETAIFASMRDITDRKRAEHVLQTTVRRHHLILASLYNGILLVSNQEQIEFANHAFCDLFNLKEAPETLIGMSGADLLKRIATVYANPTAALNRLKHLLETGRMVRDEEVPISGDRTYLRDFVPIEIEGVSYGRLWLHHDITDRKRAQQELQTSLQEKVALLNEVHHRVKNNLQVVTSLLRLEAGRSNQAETRTVLGDMQSRIRAMALLHESLYRTGVFASVELGAYIGQLATQAFRLQSQGAAVRLRLDLGVLNVSMDQATPCGLLVNELISNSLKHGFPDGRSGELRVTLQSIPGASAFADETVSWRLCVSDTGVGLPDDFEDRRSRSLGLQLVSDLVRQIGGALVIGPGAAFAVTFKADTTDHGAIAALREVK